jgi:hypothetical protein
MSTIRHIAGEMEDQIQRCVICGYEILNYQGSVWVTDEPPMKGFREGEVFVTREHGRLVTLVPPDDNIFEDCKP